jgi:hypothetical protein
MDWGFYYEHLTGTEKVIYCVQLTGSRPGILLWTANWKWTGDIIVNRQLEMDWGFYCELLTGNGVGILLRTANWNWTGKFLVLS